MVSNKINSVRGDVMSIVKYFIVFNATACALIYGLSKLELLMHLSR